MSCTGHSPTKPHSIVISVSETKELIVVKVKVKDEAEINKLRQKIHREATTLVIDTVEVLVNTSVIEDEVLAHRLSLIPFRASAVSVETETAAVATVELKSSRTGYLFSRDIDCSSMTVSPACDDVVITKLLPGEELHFRATLKSGSGKLDAKWSPITSLTYRRVPGHSEMVYEMHIETTGSITWEGIKDLF